MLDNAVRLSFVGDLILLRPQVDNAYDAESDMYDFSPLFQYTEKYFKEADLAMGVFEGPTAGGGEYSTSAFDDGIPLRLNFPDSFAEAVKNAGIKYVSTANNHLLDRGTTGATRTLNVLDKTGLMHSGSYRSAMEKENNHVFLIEVRGLKLALLTYTYGVSNHKLRFFLGN